MRPSSSPFSLSPFPPPPYFQTKPSRRPRPAAAASRQPRAVAAGAAGRGRTWVGLLFTRGCVARRILGRPEGRALNMKAFFFWRFGRRPALSLLLSLWDFCGVRTTCSIFSFPLVPCLFDTVSAGGSKAAEVWINGTNLGRDSPLRAFPPGGRGDVGITRPYA